MVTHTACIVSLTGFPSWVQSINISWISYGLSLNAQFAMYVRQATTGNISALKRGDIAVSSLAKPRGLSSPLGYNNRGAPARVANPEPCHLREGGL